MLHLADTHRATFYFSPEPPPVGSVSHWSSQHLQSPGNSPCPQGRGGGIPGYPCPGGWAGCWRCPDRVAARCHGTPSLATAGSSRTARNHPRTKQREGPKRWTTHRQEVASRLLRGRREWSRGCDGREWHCPLSSVLPHTPPCSHRYGQCAPSHWGHCWKWASPYH